MNNDSVKLSFDPDMDLKNILLFERYEGVRFVLERSLRKFEKDIVITSPSAKEEVKEMIVNDDVDLLITELSRIDPQGMEITRFARQHDPDLKIVWITVMGCHELREQQKKLNIFQCIEKPLEITEFREYVLEALED